MRDIITKVHNTINCILKFTSEMGFEQTTPFWIEVTKKIIELLGFRICKVFCSLIYEPLE